MRTTKLPLGAFFVLVLLVGQLAQAQPTNTTMSTAPHPSWAFNRSIDPFTGHPINEIVLSPIKNTDGDLARTGMIIRCKDSSIDIILIWDKMVNPAGNANNQIYEVDYRIGENPPQGQNWLLTTSLLGTTYPENTVDFIEQLEKSDTFVAMVTPPASEPIIVTYHTAGLYEAVRPILVACGVISR